MASEDFTGQTLRMLHVDFDQADTDKSGFLSKEELVKVLVDNGVAQSNAEEIFDKVAKIDRNEFVNAMKHTPKRSVREWSLRKKFKKMDKNNDRFLTKQEISLAGQEGSEAGMTVDEIQKLLTFLETDKDGRIDYEEFLRVFGMQETATLMGQIFTNLDDSNDGTLSRQEMVDAVDKCDDLKINKRKILEILDRFGDDPDKKLNYRQFCEMWMASIKKK